MSLCWYLPGCFQDFGLGSETVRMLMLLFFPSVSLCA